MVRMKTASMARPAAQIVDVGLSGHSNHGVRVGGTLVDGGRISERDNDALCQSEAAPLRGDASRDLCHF